MKQINVLLHGAVNTTNFGDALFVSMFYQRLSEIDGITPIFMEGRYGIGLDNRQAIGYDEHIGRGDLLKKCRGLVYISGGYLGDGNGSMISSLRRWQRYFRIGECFMKHHKPICVIGVGGGRIINPITRRSACKILNYADTVIVRDQGTKKYFCEQHVQKEMQVTCDTALSIVPAQLPPLSDAILAEYGLYAVNHKHIFLHLTGNSGLDDHICKVIVPAIRQYVSENPEYDVIVGYDCVMSEAVIREREDSVGAESFHFYRYTSPWEFCSFLNEMDIIVTAKLHVGIVGSALSKAVISFPLHPYKTALFYEEIHASERCIPLKTVDEGMVYAQLLRFGQQPVMVDDEFRKKAQYNLDMCAEFVRKMR